MNEAEVLYTSYIANIVFNGFSAYATIMWNIVTVHAIRRTTSLPDTLKTLLLSLAVSDLFVGFVAEPFYITLLVFRRLQQGVPDYNIKPFLIIVRLFFIASLFGVVAISVDRFLAIHLHLRYQELVTRKRVVATVVALWLLSAFLSLLTHLSKHHVIFVVVFSVCVICTTVVYLRIYFAVRSHRIQILAQQLHQDVHNTELVNFLKLRKSAIGTLYVYLVFLLCYLPWYFTMVSRIIVTKPNTAIKALGLYSWTLMFLNSSLNPVVYCWKMRHIRHTIVDLLRNKFTRHNYGTIKFSKQRCLSAKRNQ